MFYEGEDRGGVGVGNGIQNLAKNALPISFYFWNLAKSYYSVLANFVAMFLGFASFPLLFTNFQLFFWVFQFLSHTLESFEWTTHSTEKHKIIVGFHCITSPCPNFDRQHQPPQLCLIKLNWTKLLQQEKEVKYDK